MVSCTSVAIPSQEGNAKTDVPAKVETFDPSDPTRIDARWGLGYKYSDYTQGASLNELRGKLALQLNKKDLVTVDVGVGRSQDVPQVADESGLTDGRFRYFRMWNVDRSILAGYQGIGTSVELQTQGQVPGTDGSNSLALGGMGAFGLGEGLATFVNPIVASVWSRNFEEHLGWTLRVDVFLTYKPGWPWKGTYLKARPSLSYGVSGALEGDGSGLLELVIGAPFTRTFWWDLQYRIFSDTDLPAHSIGREENLATRWSLFLSFTWFL
jgi:hypothetical protein